MKIPKPLACCVDSEEQHKETLKVSLLERGFEARFFSDGRKLLNFLNGDGAKLRPSFILIDVSSSGIGGFEAARRISQRPESETIPIIMMARYCCPEDKLEAQSAGAVTCLQKPVEMESVEAEIRVKKQRIAQNKSVIRNQFKSPLE